MALYLRDILTSMHPSLEYWRLPEISKGVSVEAPETPLSSSLYIDPPL